MGLDNVAVHWPRTGRFYEPVDTREFAEFIKFAEAAPPQAGPAAALATHIARSATVRAIAYTDLVDLLLGLEGVLYATDAAAEDEVMRQALAEARLASQELRWLETRLDALRDERGRPPQWSFSLLELDVLAHFYRRCTDRGFAVYADF